jgi:hypothetical protein
MIQLTNATNFRFISVPAYWATGLCYADCTGWTGCDCEQIFEICTKTGYHNHYQY